MTECAECGHALVEGVRVCGRGRACSCLTFWTERGKRGQDQALGLEARADRRRRDGTLLALAIALVVLLAPTSAIAAPTYGQRHTSNHGYIVWVRGDARWSRVHCEWDAGGDHWHFNWRMAPREYAWTTSDAGAWGDSRPQGLDCTFRRI